MGRSSSLLLLSASLSLRRRRVGKGAVTALTPHHLHKCSAVPTRSGPNANDTRPRRHGAALCGGKDTYVVRAFAHPTTPPSPKKGARPHASLGRAPPSCITPRYFASGSGRIWNFTSFGRSPLPTPSSWNGVRLPVVAQTPRPFQPAFASSMRPSKVFA